MTKYRVAVIDDNEEKNNAVSNHFDLEEEKFEVTQIIIDSDEWTKERVLKELVENKIEVVVVDYLLKSAINRIDYNGDKIVQEIALAFRNLPVVMISEEPDRALEGDINQLLFFERSDFMDNKDKYIKEIEKTIKTNRKTVSEAEDQIIELLKKNKLNDRQKERLVELDNFLEDMVGYRSQLPRYYKNKGVMDELGKNIEKLDLILKKLDEVE